MFHFKQFSVDQSGCAMKINTDGVLLGAITEAVDPKTILDIGTGTGVIALMLAQRFINAKIDAVEIDESAAKTAGRNFESSVFHDRLNIYSSSIEAFFEKYPDKKYDLIVSNPPFYVDSLKPPGAKKALAKHTDIDFFETLISKISVGLNPAGLCWLVLPMSLREQVVEYAEINGLHVQDVIEVRSYQESTPHRMIINLSPVDILFVESEITIYKSKGVYSEMYRALLQPYFLAF
nr:methyltransferase [uncultured Mucilaginibacter sp.]